VLESSIVLWCST